MSQDSSVQATYLKEITLSNLDTKSVTYCIRDSEPLIPDLQISKSNEGSILSGEIPVSNFFITPLKGIQHQNVKNCFRLKSSAVCYHNCFVFYLIR